jgi:hypothetical protein
MRYSLSSFFLYVQSMPVWRGYLLIEKLHNILRLALIFAGVCAAYVLNLWKENVDSKPLESVNTDLQYRFPA